MHRTGWRRRRRGCRRRLSCGRRCCTTCCPRITAGSRLAQLPDLSHHAADLALHCAHDRARLRDLALHLLEGVGGVAALDLERLHTATDILDHLAHLGQLRVDTLTEEPDSFSNSTKLYPGGTCHACRARCRRGLLDERGQLFVALLQPSRHLVELVPEETIPRCVLVVDLLTRSACILRQLVDLLLQQLSTALLKVHAFNDLVEEDCVGMDDLGHIHRPLLTHLLLLHQVVEPLRQLLAIHHLGRAFLLHSNMRRTVERTLRRR